MTDGAAGASPAAESTVTIALTQTTAVAGASIAGTAVVDNPTGHMVAVANGTCNGSPPSPGWISVGLSNGVIGGTPPRTLIGCAPFLVPVGTTRYPISVPTRYMFCNPDPAKATVRVPACEGPARFPPFPAGRYHVAIWVQSPLRVVNTVNVTLTKPRSTDSGLELVVM